MYEFGEEIVGLQNWFPIKQVPKLAILDLNVYFCVIVIIRIETM